MAKSEEEIQFYEKEYGIKREVREDGTCVFGGEREPCGKKAEEWLYNIAGDVDGGRPEILGVCKDHYALF
jgi:hypothetical protein